MSGISCDYLIVGGGLAGASAAAGIRELDKTRSIILLGAESHLPYERPPLSKKLWSGKTDVKEIFVHDRAYYDKNRIALALGRRAAALDAARRTVTDDRGDSYRFGKLLLATGGSPHILPIPGAWLPGVCYYRTLDDYQRIRSLALPGSSAVIIGGGFIGSEMAAALRQTGVEVTMVYPAPCLCDTVFPLEMGLAMEALFERKGVRILKGRTPVSFEKEGGRFATRTDRGEKLDSDVIIVGAGIGPSAELAAGAGLETGDGITVDGYLRTSHPEIYAAGDNARFPYQALGRQMRLEHWDNALNQGKTAGRNMAGAREQYGYMPYFFSDLFELGYEAVGEVDSRLEISADWEKPYEKGVLYYAREGKVRGVMMCNVWDRVESARGLIRRGVEAAKKLIAA
ncbi:MAG: FAD-dependent oxidoreductase [Elusimicrobiales bacterium]